jgi:hypothetical protein
VICGLCLAKVATCHITSCPSRGVVEEAHYCQSCYDLKFVNPPPQKREFPRPKVTLKRVMVVIAIFAIPNGLAAAIMRSGWIPGTPEQIEGWTLWVILGLNISISFLLVSGGLVDWLQRVHWFKRTGDVVARPLPQKLSKKRSLLLLVLYAALFVWLFAVGSFLKWLRPRIGYNRALESYLFLSLMTIPAIAMTTFNWRSSSRLRELILQTWRTASDGERRWRIAGIVWFVAFLLLVPAAPAIPFLNRYPLVLVPIVLFVLAGQLTTLAGMAFSTRRR